MSIKCRCGYLAGSFEEWETHAREDLPVMPRSQNTEDQQQNTWNEVVSRYLNKHKIEAIENPTFGRDFIPHPTSANENSC